MHEGTIIVQPRAQIFIKRPRLTNLLDEAGGRLLLLLAPAGYGKTTLAREWTGDQGGIGWYAGTPAMADVAGLSVGMAETLAEMCDPVPHDMVERVRILAARGHDARGLAKAVSVGAPGGDALLVVDDYHYAAGSAEAETFFEELVALTDFRLLITSRERPSWLAARKVIYGEVAVVEMDALAFTNEEARAVLGSDGADQLLVEARGWPAVIGLAAMRGTTDVAAGLPPDDLYRFFAEDLFRSARPELRDAMFRFALTGDAGVEGARELLGPAHLELVAEAAERGFLRTGGRQAVHPLLRGFLLAKLAELEADAVRPYVVQAVEFLAERKRWDDCLFVLERFPENELIISTLESGLVDILYSGRVVTVQGWLELARRRVIDSPLLVLAEAEVALRSREDERAQALGSAAAALLEGDLAARAYVVAARGAHFRDDNGEATRLAMHGTRVAVSSDARLDALWTAFTSVLEFQHGDAAKIFRELKRVKGSSPTHLLRLYTAKGMLLCVDGSISEGLEHLQLATAFLERTTDPFARTNLLHYIAYLRVLGGLYEEALTSTDLLIDEAEKAGLEFAIDHGLLRRAAAHIGLRRLGDAQRTIAQLQRRADNASDFIRDNISLLHVRHAIAAGDIERAAILLREPPPGPRPAFHGEVSCYQAIVAASLGDVEAAKRALQIGGRSHGFAELAALAEVGHAILDVAAGISLEPRLPTLRRMVFSGNCDAFVVGSRAFPQLAAHCAADTELRDGLTRLFARSRDRDVARMAGLRIPRELRPREQLSPRERDVYELLVQGRTNHEIAKTLFISESTTKVHVRHIFEKLGVHSRAAAARLASPEGSD